MQKLVFTLIMLHTSVWTFAQIIDPFSIRYQANQKGGIRMLSNVNISCGTCSATSEIPPSGTGDNNSYSFVNINVDSDPSTFNSSSDKLNLANCSEISWAGLYWVGQVGFSGSSVPNYSNRNQIKLKVNTGVYQTLVADELLDNVTGKYTYHCFKDITNLVQSNPINATYTIANVVAEQDYNSFGAWTMVVVYKNVYESMKNLTVFDGLTNITPGTGNVDIVLSGFLTPPVGPVSFELGVVAHDGDRGQMGDQLRFNGAGTFLNVSDALHNFNDLFNSTISRNGVLTPFRLPNYNNTMGHDANIFSPNNASFNYLGNNATSATIRISTTSETLLNSIITSAIEIYEPDLRSSVTYVDVNGGTLNPGDVVEYKIVSKNIGSDVSLGTVLIDTLDQRLTYVPGSISIISGPNAGNKTDALDADQAEFNAVNNVISVRIGTGANGTNGGSLVNSPTGADSTVVKFQATLNPDCLVWQCGPSLENEAFLSGTGQISGIQNNNGGLSDDLDANGCPTNQSAILIVNTSNCADTVITYDDTLCVGEMLQLNFPYSPLLNYSWSGPNGFQSSLSSPSIPNVGLTNSGLYTLQVLYAGNQCITDSLAPLFVSAIPSIQVNQIHNDSCYGLGLGFIDLAVIGDAPFVYSWSNGESTPSIDSLNAGAYSLTVWNAHGCDTSASFIISEPPLLVNSTNITTNYNGSDISCFGANDANLNSVVSGGVAPYTYNWNLNNSNLMTLMNAGPGYHVCTVTDANGCQKKDSSLVQEPDSISMMATLTDVLCFGDATGNIDLQINGGTAPYTYNWSNSSITQDITGLPTGNYTCTVTDVNGCSKSASYFINQPSDSMYITFLETNVLCHGEATGSIDLTVINGNAPYTYAWSNSAITEDISNLTSGNYTVWVTDAHGCQQTVSAFVAQPFAPIQINQTHNNNLCFGDSTGSIDITVSGGTPNYAYTWSNGATLEDIYNLASANYTVIVTDSNNCLDSLQISVQQPNDLQLTSVITHVLCYNYSTGAVDLAVVGGTQPYTYQWSNSAIIQDITNLSSGDYTVQVSDFNGCQDSLTAHITQPSDSMYITSTNTPILCQGNSTGTIDLTVSNGAAPLTFLWNTGATSEDLTGLSAGSYSCVITDNNGCSQQFSTFLTEPPILSHTFTSTNPSCIGGVQGSLAVNISGGTPNYHYLWNNNQITPAMTNLNAGTYTCVVTDTNGCLENISISLVDPTAVVLASNHTNISCNGGSDGTIDLTVSGGTPDYTFQWSNGQISEDLSNLSSGNYFVNAYDFYNCGVFLSVLLTEPTAPISVSDTQIVNNLCHSYSNGSIDVTIQGGTSPYNFVWSNGATSEDIQNLQAGNYILTITDANNCILNFSGNITQPTQVTMSESHQNILCYGEATGSIDISTSGGIAPYTYLWNNTQITEDVSNLLSGIYTVISTDLNSCTDTLSVTLTEPNSPLSITSTISHVLCFGGNNGEINVSVNGGTPNYDYSWSNNSTSEDLTNLISGSYTITIIDDNGCSDSISSVVNQPTAPISLNSSSTPVLCYGGNTGTAQVVASGGTAGYSYLWSNGATTSTISGLSAGIYFVTVNDTNGCQENDTIVVFQPTLMMGQISHQDVLCHGDATGTLTSSVTGGIAPYTYTWNNGVNSNVNANVIAGFYSIIIMDSNQCTITLYDTINQPLTGLAVGFNLTHNLCYGDTLGIVDATVTGGTSPYTFSWDNGENTEDLVNLPEGMYIITVSDLNNCQLIDTVFINEPTEIFSTNPMINHVSCFAGSNGAIDLTVIGGVGPYLYDWNDPLNSTTQDISNLGAGSYSVAISDSNNCLAYFNYSINEPPILAALTTLIEPTCFGYNDGEIQLITSGGVFPYTYNWNNGTSNDIANNLTTGYYSVLITDFNQCTIQIDTFLSEPDQFHVDFIVDDTVGCNPLEVHFTNTSDFNNKCTWDFGDGLTSVDCNPTHIYFNAGCQNVTLTVESPVGCTNSLTKQNYICINPKPVAALAASPNELLASNSETSITNLSSGGFTYVWDMGDGNSNLTFFEPGLYVYPSLFLDQFEITLEVTSDKGCKDTARILITMDNEIIAYVPNAFTPNNDEANPTFRPIVPKEISGYELTIYDRWGELIFISNDPETGWDGTYKGIAAQEGVYIWMLRLKSNQKDNPMIRKGHVTLLK